MENALGMRELCQDVGKDREEEVRVVQGSAGKGQGHDLARES